MMALVSALLSASRPRLRSCYCLRCSVDALAPRLVRFAHAVVECCLRVIPRVAVADGGSTRLVAARIKLSVLRSVHPLKLRWGQIAVAVLLFGVSIVIGQLLIGTLLVRRIAKQGAKVTEARCLHILDELGHRLALTRTPVLRGRFLP